MKDFIETPTVTCLNEAFERDPGAIHTLIVNRIPCNAALADDPLIQVGLGFASVKNEDQQYFQVGALGLINGVLAANGLPLVAVKFSDEPDEYGRRTILGFQEYLGGSA
jgi:hypothetical protein